MSALAGVFALASLCCLVAWLRPLSPQSPAALQGLAAAVTGAAALGLHLARSVREQVLHLLLGTGLVATTCFVALAATPQGSAIVSIGYTWGVLYAAYYFSRRSARLYTALNAVGYGLALLHNPYPGASMAWAVITVTSVCGGERLGGLLDRLREDARTDRLTGVLNRHGLDETAPRRLAQAARTGEPVTVAVLDLDDFKQVNDRHGHAAGDEVLVDLTRRWRSVLRDEDVLARSGGDEFVLLLSARCPDQARALLGELRRASPSPWSYGVAAARPDDDLSACLARADEDLYRAKGRRAAHPAEPAASRLTGSRLTASRAAPAPARSGPAGPPAPRRTAP